MRRARGARHAFAALLALALAGSGGAQSTGEYEIKAAYLYNFAKFVRWPAPPDGPDEHGLVLCVLGEDPFGAALDALVGREVQRRPIRVRRLAPSDPPDGCHVLFVAASEAPRLAGVVAALDARAGLLTVSDVEGFVGAGGMVELVLDARRVRFDVDVARAARAGLELSSKLLNLARRVRETP